jgi:hypothetical protein
MLRISRTLLALAALMTPLVAQSPTLTFNGEQSASASLGRNLEIKVTAQPGDVVIIGLNLDPGPSQFMGMTVPIGTGPGLLLSPPNLPTDANGLFVDTSIRPSLTPALEGFKVYGLALVAGPSYPGGMAFTNGADFTLVRRVDAGPDGAGLVGEPVVANALANIENSPLPAGYAFAWEVIESPSNANFSLAGADTPLPTLTTDTPGTYRLECGILAPGTSGGAVDNCRLRVYDLDFGGRVQGGFDDAANLAVTATATGPSGASLDLSGVGSSSTATVSGTLMAQTPFAHTVAEITAPGGARTARGLTTVSNAGLAADQILPDAAVLMIREGLFDELETLLDQALATVDLSAPLNAAIAQIPPFEVLNVPAPFPPGVTAFSATIEPTGLTFDPGLNTDLTPTATALELSVSLSNLALNFNLSGLIFNNPYTDTGVLSVASADLTVGLQTVVQADGSFLTTVTSTDLDFVMPNLTLTNGTIPSAFLAPLVTGLSDGLELALAPLVGGLLPPIFDTALNAIPTTLDLGAATLDLAVSQVLYDAGGLGLVLDGAIDIDGSSNAGLVYATPNPAPTSFPALAPATGMPYLLATSVSDDLINRALAAAQDAGLLEIQTGDGVDLTGGLIPANAAGFAFVFPGLGLEDLDPATPVRVRITNEVAPVASFNGSGDFVLNFSDGTLAVEAEVASGYWAPVARAGIAAELGLDLMIDPMTNELSFNASGGTFELYARSARAGLDIAPALALFEPGLSLLYPTLVSGIPPIALPMIGGTTINGIADVQNEGPAGDYLTIYVD